jgi:hypothetical protein
MDPNANLREQRELAKEILHIQDNCSAFGEFTYNQEQDLIQHAQRLAELVEALDGWIKKGGFLPDNWQVAQKGRL